MLAHGAVAGSSTRNWGQVRSSLLVTHVRVLLVHGQMPRRALPHLSLREDHEAGRLANTLPLLIEDLERWRCQLAPPNPTPPTPHIPPTLARVPVVRKAEVVRPRDRAGVVRVQRIGRKVVREDVHVQVAVRFEQPHGCREAYHAGAEDDDWAVGGGGGHDVCCWGDTSRGGRDA